MLSEEMELRIRSLLLPFTEYSFYIQDSLSELAKARNTRDYNEEFETHFLPTAYQTMSRSGRITSIDKVKLLLTKYFPPDKLHEFSSGGQDMSSFYINHLSYLSHIFLTHRNGRIALKYWESEREHDLLGPYSGLNKVAMWNSMNRMFTTDILVMLYLLRNGMRDEQYLAGYDSSVYLADTQLDQILSKGVAETHLHLNAGGSFSINWIHIMSPVSNRYDLYEYDVFMNQATGVDLQPYVRAMAIVRILLAVYLSHREAQDDLSSFCALLGEISGCTVLDFFSHISQGYELDNGSLDYDEVYQHLKLKYNLLPSESQEEEGVLFYSQDTIKSLFSLIVGNYSTEDVLLFRCLKYILDFSSDLLFSTIFWQYVRIKNQVLQIHVQSNSTKGLEYFGSYYARATKHSDRAVILGHQFQNPFLKKIEVRITTGAEQGESKKIIMSKVAERVVGILKIYKALISQSESERRSVPALGMVFHFIKKGDEDGIEKCWIDYNPSPGQEVNTAYLNPEKLYFQQRRDHYLTEMEAIRELRESVPGLSEYIVGIDAAGSELAVEPWVFAPVFQQARDSSNHKVVHAANEAEYMARVRNLGLTYHVGEDFRHLLTGIRRVHEVVEHFQFHAGDRVGHAICLGIDPQQWQMEHPVTILPRIEYLENLLWMWGIHKGEDGVKVDNTYLEQEILVHAKRIFLNMEGITLFSLWQAYRKKFKMSNVSDNEHVTGRQDTSRVFCPFVKGSRVWNAERLANAYHCKCYLEPMLDPIEVSVGPNEISAMIQAQKVVRRLLSNKGIVVETNPTSNVAIGEIENIFKHHILALNSRGLDTDMSSENRLMVSINTDDPVVFNTNINNEFAYLFYSLLDKGHSRDDALWWIDNVRELGMRSSFIDERGMTIAERKDEVSRIIDALEENY